MKSLTHEECEKKCLTPQGWTKLFNSYKVNRLLLIYEFEDNHKSQQHAFVIHFVDPNWLVIDNVEEFVQYMIEDE
jgi:hypothetical protein